MKFPPKSKIIKVTKTLTHLFYLSIVICVAVACINRGFSQYNTRLATDSATTAESSQAIEFDPTNPEAYAIRGFLFLQTGNYQEAANDFRKGISLRPDDYLLWLRLGYANDKLNDFVSAKNAYSKALSLAPNYSQPYQYMGRLFLKTNNPVQGFFYLSRAAEIDITFLPEVLQLAHVTFSNDPVAIERAIHPNSVKAKTEMAFYFVKYKMMTDEVSAFLTGEQLDEKTKDVFIESLIKIKNYRLAFAISVSKDKTQTTPAIASESRILLNGNFETDIDTDHRGFGWQITREANIKISFDNTEAYFGLKKLKIQFNGNSNPANPVISQLTLVKPNQKYRLTFAANSQKLTTGGLPFINIVDTDSGKTIAQSAPLPEQSDKWQKYTIDFDTIRAEAVNINVSRLKCSSSPCPIFGTLSLDNFTLEELSK